MDLIQLKVVKAIHGARSLSKASTRLGRAPSIVSRHLTAFERECGGRIFHRTGRGLELTELGEQMMPQIDLVIQALDRMVGCGKTALSGIAGNVRVTVAPDICEHFVSALFSAIKQEYPLVRLQLSEGSSSLEVDQALEKGSTDVAVFLRNGISVGPNHETICELDTCLISLPGTDLPGAALVARPEILFGDLVGLPLLMPSEPELARHAIIALAESRGISLSIVAEVNSSSMMKTLFERGAGYLIASVGHGQAAEIGYIGRHIREGRARATPVRGLDLKRTLVVGTAASVASRVEVVRKATVRILREITQAGAQEWGRTFPTRERPVGTYRLAVSARGG